MKNIGNKLKKIGLIWAGSWLAKVTITALTTCNAPNNNFCKIGKYKEYNVEIKGINDSKNKITITDGTYSLSSNVNYLDECTFKFSNKHLNSPYPNSKEEIEGIREYLNIDSLGKVYNYVMKHGKNCNEVKE